MLVITACNDEEITVPKNENKPLVAVSGGDPKYIVFESVIEYDSILDTLSNMDDSMLIAWTQGFVGFTSRLESNTEIQLEADGIYDELLAAILNEQNIVQIEDHVFQLNFSTEQVYVLNQTDYNNPSDFDTENPNMDIYSFDDYVLDAVANKRRKPTCGKKYGPEKWHPQSPNTNKWLKRKVVYQEGGIYFSLIAKHKKNYTGRLQFGINEPAGISEQPYYKADGGTKTDIHFSDNPKPNSGNPWKPKSFEFRPYKSGTPLEEYYFGAYFYYTGNLENMTAILDCTP